MPGLLQQIISGELNRAMNAPLNPQFSSGNLAADRLVQEQTGPPATIGGAVKTGMEFSPGLGDAMALEQGIRELQSGNIGAGMLNMATAVPGIGDAAMLAKMGGGILPGLMTAYHGTPHRFPPTESNPLGEFDLSKIGTGEGAQAYGHGIYLAEDPGTAKSYQVDLAPGRGTDPAVIRGYEPGLPAGVSGKWGLYDKKTGYQDTDFYFDTEAEAQKFIDNADEQAGHLYDVDLPDEQIAKMLDWDAPLSEQPESVRKGIKQVVDYQDFDDFDNLALAAVRGTHPRGGYDPVGKDIYQELSDLYSDAGSLDPSVMASKELNTLGIPGIKYYDAGSRTAGEGTRNFVMFDPSVSTIIGRR